MMGEGDQPEAHPRVHARLRLALLLLASFVAGLLPRPVAVAADEPSTAGLRAAATDADEPAALDAVEVEEAFEPLPSTEAGEAADARAWGGRSAADLLGLLRSVQIHENVRGEPSIVFRGFDERQLSVRVEGVPWESPWDGRMQLAMLPLRWLRGAQARAGAGSARDGSTSLGGGVDFGLAAPSATPLVAVESSFSTPGAAELAAQHGAESGALSWSLSAGLLRSLGRSTSSALAPSAWEDGGVRDNTDSQRVDLLARVGVDLGDAGQLLASFGWIDASFGVPVSTTTLSPRWWRFDTWRSGLAGLRHEMPGRRLRMQSDLWFNHFGNVLEAYDDASYSTQTSSGAFRSEYADWGVGLTELVELQPQPLGGSHFLDAALRLEASFDQHRSVADRGAREQVAERVRLNLLPELGYAPFDGLRLEAGCELQSELDPDGAREALWGLGGHFGAVWTLGERLELDARGSRSLRFPTLKERYADTPGALAEAPELHPEGAWQFELGARWQPVDPLALGITAFDAELQDLIELVNLGDGVQQLRNRDAARQAGVSLDGGLRPWEALHLSLSYAFLWARAGDGEPLQHRPEHRLRAEFGWLGERWQASLQWEWVGEQRSSDPFRSGLVELGAYHVGSLRAQVQLADGVELWLHGRNLLDANFQTSYGYPAPGREASLGLRIAL